MKLATITSLALAAATLCACGKKDEAAKAPDAASAGKPAAALGPATPPARKFGLWETTIATQDGRTQVTSICFDAEVDRRMSVWGQAAGQQACETNTITPKLGGGWTFNSVCDLGPSGRMVTTGETTGDFNTAYKTTFTSTTTGATVAQMNGTQTSTINAVWKGACPADMKPGDMMLPGGMKMNILGLTAQMEAMKKK